MKNITATDLRLNPYGILDEASKGESFVVTLKGTKVALILPYHGQGQDQDEVKDHGLDLDLKKIKKEILTEVLSRMEQSRPESSSLDLKNDPSMIKIRKRIDNLESAIESIVHKSSGRTLPEPDADALEELEEEISSLASRVKDLEDTIKSMSRSYD